MAKKVNKNERLRYYWEEQDEWFGSIGEVQDAFNESYLTNPEDQTVLIFKEVGHVAAKAADIMCTEHRDDL